MICFTSRRSVSVSACRTMRPSSQNRDFVGHRLDFVQQVRAVEHGPPFALQMRDEIAVELLPHDRVEPKRRVVEDHQLRPMGQREHQARAAHSGLWTGA